MPWIIEDTAEESGKNFIRKLPGGRTMYTEFEDATVYRTKKDAEKEASRYDEFFVKATGERISEDQWWKGNQSKCSFRPSSTLVLHKISFVFGQSEKFSRKGKK